MLLPAHCADGDKWRLLFEARSGERMDNQMTTWKTTYISAAVHQAGDNPIINEQSTTVTICDEAAGAFISLTDSEGTTIKLDPDEFKIVANVAKGMIECFEDKQRTPISVINDSFNKSEAIIRSFKDEMSYEDDKETLRPATPFAATCDLLAVIHRDGGQHTGEVGTVQSCKDAESVVRELRSDGARSKSGGWTSTEPKKGGIYWVKFDHGLAPRSVEVYRLDEDDVWRARVVGGADILGSHVASFQVSSLTNSLWNGPISAPPLP